MKKYITIIVAIAAMLAIVIIACFYSLNRTVTYVFSSPLVITEGNQEIQLSLVKSQNSDIDFYRDNIRIVTKFYDPIERGRNDSYLGQFKYVNVNHSLNGGINVVPDLSSYFLPIAPAHLIIIPKEYRFVDKESQKMHKCGGGGISLNVVTSSNAIIPSLRIIDNNGSFVREIQLVKNIE